MLKELELKSYLNLFNQKKNLKHNHWIYTNANLMNKLK